MLTHQYYEPLRPLGLSMVMVSEADTLSPFFWPERVVLSLCIQSIAMALFNTFASQAISMVFE